MSYYVPLRIGDYLRQGEQELYITEFFPNLNVLTSAQWFLKGKKAREMCASCSLRERLDLRGGFLGDSAAFTIFRRFGGLKGLEEMPTSEAVAGIYQMMDVDAGFHTDIPVAFLNVASDTKKLLEKNLALAETCRNTFRRLIPDIELIPVAQGLHSFDYHDQVTHFAAQGHARVAVGGLHGRKVWDIREILQRANIVAYDEKISIHALGCGRMSILGELIAQKTLSSFDSLNPIDAATRSKTGEDAYYFWLDAQGELEKLRLDKIWSGEIELPVCDCEPCQLFGEKIVDFGKCPRNRARQFHNTFIFDKYIKSWSPKSFNQKITDYF